MAAPRKRDALRESISRQVSGANTPTNADNVSESPTNADRIELVRITGRIARRQRDALERIAKRDGRLLSDLLREAIRDYLERH